MGLRATALGCTHIAALEWFLGGVEKEVGASREQDKASSNRSRSKAKIASPGLREEVCGKKEDAGELVRATPDASLRWTAEAAAPPSILFLGPTFLPAFRRICRWFR